MPSSTASLKPFISNDLVTVTETQTVGEITQWLKSHKQDFQNKFAYLYVVNSSKELIGILSVRDLLVEEPSTPISNIMKGQVFSVFETSPIENALKLFCEHEFFALPVVNDKEQLVGVIPSEKIKKLITPEIRKRFSTSELNEEEIEGSHIHVMVMKRLPWLLISVTTGIICAYILGLFIGRIESVIALILFLPVVLGIAGSVGTQSARIVSRSLDRNQLSLNSVGSILGKQLLFGCSIGGVSFLNVFLIALLWKKSPVEGIALGLSIIAITVACTLLGHFLPIVFRMFRLDKAASGLFILLICDMFALILYFAISLALVSPGLELT